MSNIITMTLEEIVNFINQELTIGCSFTQILPNTEIERIITKAINFWYQHYYYAVQKGYYLLDKNLMYEDTYIKTKSIQLPHDVQNITWLWELSDPTLLHLGLNVPNLSIGLGVTNQPYLSSMTTTIAELGVYKVVLDSLSDMMDQLSKFTIKYDYNQSAKRLNLLGGFKGNLLAECFVQVEQEYIFADPEFQEYAIALCLKQLGTLLTRFSYQLQGGVTINGEAVLAEGKERETAVLERTKNLGNTSFMFLVKR